MSMPLILGKTETAMWHNLIGEAIAKSGAHISGFQERYLALTLERHRRNAGVVRELMAVKYLKALTQAGRQLRRENLQNVGDMCLLVVGLSPNTPTRARV